MENARIVRVERATLMGARPREAGNNARLNIHGIDVSVPLARLTTDDGATGFGFSQASPEDAQAILGAAMTDLLSAEAGVADAARALDFPLWDLLGQLTGKPVYQLAAPAIAQFTEPLRVPCYDTSLYMNDLGIETDEAGAALIAEHAREGYERNHRSFKIKVGRGARHMPLEAGTRRDIAVIKAVREAIGPEATILIDANNGYNFNIARRVLAETADCNVFWLEEAFHEDPELYETLHDWMGDEGLSVLIADGEGWAAEGLMDWARAGFVDVVQYDIFSHGFSNWLDTGAQLDKWGVRSGAASLWPSPGQLCIGTFGGGGGGLYLCRMGRDFHARALMLQPTASKMGRWFYPTRPASGWRWRDEVFRAAVKNGGFELLL